MLLHIYIIYGVYSIKVHDERSAVHFPHNSCGCGFLVPLSEPRRFCRINGLC